MIFRAILLTMLASALPAAQDASGEPPSCQERLGNDLSNPPTAPQSTKSSGPRSPNWKGLTVKEKLAYDWRHLFDADNLVFAGVGAGSISCAAVQRNGAKGGARMRADTVRTWVITLCNEV